MEGDLIYVIRKPLLWKSVDCRKSIHSTQIDRLISRLIQYKHYGIEVENDQVIHFVTESIFLMDQATVIKTPMAAFVKDGVKLMDKQTEVKFSRERIIKRAYSRLNTNFEGYHISKNNCEHFATWCALGCSQSRQAKITTYPVQAKKKIIKYPLLAKNKLVKLFAVI